MNNNITWIIITDGYYIKIMVNEGPDTGLKTLRDNDFEQTSTITYNLVTHKRNIQPESTSSQYFYDSLTEFLNKNALENIYGNLVIIAPESVLEQLQQNLPESVTNKIHATITGDYLAATQDKLEVEIAKVIS